MIFYNKFKKGKIFNIYSFSLLNVFIFIVIYAFKQKMIFINFFHAFIKIKDKLYFKIPLIILKILYKTYFLQKKYRIRYLL